MFTFSSTIIIHVHSPLVIVSFETFFSTNVCFLASVSFVISDPLGTLGSCVRDELKMSLLCACIM